MNKILIILVSASPQATSEGYLRNVITGCRNPRHVALTFDDGISDYTEELLDILHRHRVKATFFILGRSLNSNQNKKILVRMVREGHIVGSHSYDHPDLTNLSHEDIRSQMISTDEAIQSVIGLRPRFMRPPYGYVDQNVVRTLSAMGYLIINWNHDTNDWKFQNNFGTIVSYVQNEISFPRNTDQGPIILQHDSLQSSIRLQSGIIKILRRKGYEFVSMYECLGQEPYRR